MTNQFPFGCDESRNPLLQSCPTEEDEEEMHTVTASLAAAEETNVDAAVVAAGSGWN